MHNMITNAHTMYFWWNIKIHNIILKTEQTIVYAQWDRWALYVIKHHMITTFVIIKIAPKAMRNLLCWEQVYDSQLVDSPLFLA